MYLGDMVKRVIDFGFKMLRIRKPDQNKCGCEQRRLTLNMIGWNLKNRFKGWYYDWKYREPKRSNVIKTSIDLDKFRCQWEGVASGMADRYLTSNPDTYASLKLSGYNVEMKQ
jgi:hypothetical protein